MNWAILAIILAVVVALNFVRLPFLLWLILCPIIVYAIVRFGITPWVPLSVLKLYLCLVAVGLIVYLFVDEERYNRVRSQLAAFLADARYRVPRVIVVLLLPALLAGMIYLDSRKEIRAPTFGRTIHPAPPNEIDFKGKSIDLIKGKNPFRELEHSDPSKFLEHVSQGKDLYYKNCVYCHGDDLNGDGIFAHGLSPVPANLNSATTIAMLQESYLFWRIAKGGPGLPEESGPWSSSMPAWEKYFTEDDIWNVILFLYHYTGFHPRAEEVHE